MGVKVPQDEVDLAEAGQEVATATGGTTDVKVEEDVNLEKEI